MSRPNALILRGTLATLLFAAACSPSTSTTATTPKGPASGDFTIKPPPPHPPSPRWKEVERLTKEQKFKAASKVVEQIRVAASKAGLQQEWARALIKEVQLRMALHGYETSVRYLRQQAWPKSPLPAMTLSLYYGRALVRYLQSYSWEIRQREQVSQKGPVDLKRWTQDQIFAEAQQAYLEVWAQRKGLSGQPVGLLRENLSPNTYPKGVRSTMRDAVSYLFVELLGNTNFWQASHSNQVYRLSFNSLLAGDPQGSADRKLENLKLEDPEVHPLLKICAVLDDLEAWHKKQQRPEAALEARLERLRRLGRSFTSAREKEEILKHLEALLSDKRRLPWWSMGMAQLAELYRQRGDLVRARSLALQGHKEHPSTPGGARCLYLARSIEARDFQLRAMATDGLKRRSIQISHKNLETLYFRAFRRNLKDRISMARDYNLLPNNREMRAILASKKPDVTWMAKLPRTPDYANHQTYVFPPLKKKGMYLIIASANKSFSETNNRVLGVNFIASDLALLSRRMNNGDLDVSVRSGASGSPVAGARVHLYRYQWGRGKRHHKVDTRRSRADGSVLFKALKDRRHHSHFLVAEKGSDINLDVTHLRLYSYQRNNDVRRTLIYTDRSVYRPLQKLHYKVIVYKGKLDQARFQTAGQAKLTVSLLDPNHQVVKKQTLKTNSFGSSSGSFVIPAGRVLGRWTIRSSISGQAGVRVEEYKRPTFEVKLKDPEGALRLNRPARIKGEARYYFGLPVTDGQVRWRVMRQAVYPWWWGYYWSYGRSSRSQLVAQGEASLKPDGTFDFQFTPAADERQEGAAPLKDLTYRYAVSADLTDEGGETRSASRSFRLGLFSVEAHISASAGFFRAGKPSAMTIRRTNLDGVARPGKGSWEVLSLLQPARAVPPADLPQQQRPLNKAGSWQTPGDKLRPRWSPGYSYQAVMASWKDGGQQGKGALVHDKKGSAKVPLPALRPGAYRLRYQTKDEFGATFKTWKDFVVAGKRMPLALPALMLTERYTVKVGSKARILVHSGLPRQVMFLDIFKAGKLVQRRRLRAGGDPIIEIPITERDRGGFGVSLSVLRDHQHMNFSQSLYVPWDNKQLKLEFATFRDKLRPGQKETWRVTVKHAAGKKAGQRVAAGAAELLAYMYDRSLDLFAPHSPPSALSIFPHRTGTVWIRTNLKASSTQWLRNDLVHLPGYPTMSPDRLKFFSGYGIGGLGYRGARYRLNRFSAIAGDDESGAMPPRAPQPSAAPAVARQQSASRKKKPAEADKVTTISGEISEREEGRPGSRDQAQAPQVRSKFSETAFFQPHLVLGQDGSASIVFQVPDSVTGWNVWVHAITRDLSSGSLKRGARTVKDLMVRPYLPRFFREGDQAALKVVVNNASNKELKGKLILEILDPQSEKSVAASFGLKQPQRPFTVPAGGGANLTFAVKVPPKVGTVAFRVIARADNLSDGEIRPLPVLPGRMHLAQSRFVTLRDKDRRTMTFADLRKGGDPTLVNESLVVTIDAQLFYTVLKALPYLVNYPYQCTEQTLNRFISTGILSSMYKDYPAVARMAAKLAQRKTRLETWDQADPNRKMTLEESPWLLQAKGGKDTGHELARVLDPRIARAVRDASLAKLKKAQTGSGGFPWFPGGPPSPYITLYLMHGFAKALEFGVDVPKAMVQRGWAYLGRHFRQHYVQWMIDRDCCWEFLTFLNYVASAYPDPSWTRGGLTKKERTKILDFTFGHWKQHSPMLKAYLALTLKRMGRPADGKLVFASVMDSAKTEKDRGTYWAQEDRSWLWYRDTIETHAFALRALMELEPKNAKKDGLVLWLLINKKLNHWKSTRATSEVIYSLVHYLKAAGALGIREEATVKVGNKQERFVFEPDQFVGKSQLVVPGPEIHPKTSSTITVEKKTKGFMFASATWHFSTEKLPAAARGDFFSVQRKYYKRELVNKKYLLRPLSEGTPLKPGDQVEVQLSLRAKHAAEYVHLRDPRAAGLEPENAVSRYKWDLGISWYEETRDSGANFFFEALPVGQYTFKYRLRANMAGTFKVGPAMVQCLYAPEFVAYSSGKMLTVSAPPIK